MSTDASGAEASPPRGADELGQLLSVVAAGGAVTRSDLARLTGLARSTVSHRVDLLLRSGVLRDLGDGPSTGGRRPLLLALNPGFGVVLAADIGATHCRMAVADLAGRIAAEFGESLEVASGPDVVLDRVIAGFQELLGQAGRDASDVRAIGIGVPGPVEFATGTVVQPPIMPGWDGLAIPERLRGHFPAPVLVDNDVNMMALGEYAGRTLTAGHLLFVKVSTGIGCGIISHGQVHRGADGAAGDIGHIRVTDQDETVCACGNTGCLEAVASGSAVARRLSAEGLPTRTARDVVKLAQGGDARAVRSVRLAGERIGEVLASLVNFYNPSDIIIGGSLAELRDDLLAGIRGVVYHRALPLATRRLTIETTALGPQAGVLGGVALASHHARTPTALARFLVTGALPRARAGLPGPADPKT
jgi:predicted NBD/HSP70 family sugar kinase